MDEKTALLPKLPLGSWVEAIVGWLTDNVAFLFDGIHQGIHSLNEWFVWLLSIGYIPGYAFILAVIIALITWRLMNWKAAVLTIIGLLLVNNLGMWDALVKTLSLVVIAVIIAIIIGVPFGIWMSQKKGVQSAITPILDFMQTMPSFVYLIPAVIFFGIGVVPGVISTIVFSLPPTVRLTNLGIRQVDESLIEAANAFGSTTGQRLGKVQVPLAMPTIMAGINQTIMLSLSMVVIASMVGAPGLGKIVNTALQRVDTGLGFESGLGIVIIAMILDRVSQAATKK